MNTEDILVFTTAAKAGSLSEAARRLGLSPMTATRRLAALEDGLGVRLLHRTTRALSLTPEGDRFLPLAEALLENANQAASLFQGPSAGASGLLRVSVSSAFGRKIVAPFLPALLAKNPQLRVSLDMEDHQPDLVASGIDLAIRIARLRDSSLIGKKLAENKRSLVASPDYLERSGIPQTTADISQFECLPVSGISHWTFHARGSAPSLPSEQELHVRLQSRFSSNSIDGCRAACLAGAGVALLSDWNIAGDLAAGRLQRISLEDAEPESSEIWAVYPTSKYVLPKVRVFIAAVQQALAKVSHSPDAPL